MYVIHSIYLLIGSIFTYFSVRISRIWTSQFPKEVYTYNLQGVTQRKRRESSFWLTDVDKPEMAGQHYQGVETTGKSLDITVRNLGIACRDIYTSK